MTKKQVLPKNKVAYVTMRDGSYYNVNTKDLKYVTLFGHLYLRFIQKTSDFDYQIFLNSDEIVKISIMHKSRT